MRLNTELAQKIVKEARSSLDEHFIIVDTNFRIIASSDPSRVGQFHEGAKTAIEEDRTVVIKPEDVPRLKGVKPGINMPIKHEGEVIGVIGITGNPQDVRPFAELIRRLTELFIKEVVQAEQLESQSRAMEAFVYEWARKDRIDEALINQSEILGFSILKPALVIMGHVSEKEPDVFKRLSASLLRLFRHPIRVIRWSNQRFILFIDAPFYERKSLKARLENTVHCLLNEENLHVTMGVAKEPRAKLIRPSFIEAEVALNSATLDRPVVFYESLTLEILLQDISQENAAAFLKNSWQPVLENDELAETLVTYLKHNLSVSKAAEALHVHVNTLHYRIRRMEELSGLTLRTTEGMASAYLAIRLYEKKHLYS